MERYTDVRAKSFRIPSEVVELVFDLEWAVEADSAPDRDRGTERRRHEARDALLRFLAGVTPNPSTSLLIRM
jgi:hypothetical protein